MASRKLLDPEQIWKPGQIEYYSTQNALPRQKRESRVV